MGRYVIFGLYNMAYQVLSIGILFFANTYINDIFIPDRYRWKDGALREDFTALAVSQSIILIIEAVILSFFLLKMNVIYLTSIAKSDRTNNIAMWTSGIHAFITFGFVIYLMCVVHK